MQAQFHPLKYLEALARALENKGGRIFNKTHAQVFKDGEPAQVTTVKGFVVSAGAVVVATNTPVNNWVAIHTKQAAYRTFVVGLRIPKGSVTKALYWDTPDSYHYIRLQEAAGHEVLIVGGEDHKTGQADDMDQRLKRLEAWARERFPTASEIEFRWSGQTMEEPVDGLAYIGRNPGEKNVYVVTGDSGNGMTHGMIAGILLTDLILGRNNEWEALYEPSRVSLRAASEFASENLNVVAQYQDYVTAGDAKGVREIETGTGALIRDGLKKVAVYRIPVANCTSAPPYVRTSVALWIGTPRREPGIGPATDLASTPNGNVLNGPANTGLSSAE